MSEEGIIASHLEFFSRNRTGCAFAVLAARDAERFEWGCDVVGEDDLASVSDRVGRAVAAPAVSTLSLIFPHVRSDRQLEDLISRLDADTVYLHSVLDTERNRCYRFRARIGAEESYVSGFGPFPFLPPTRRADHAAIVFRVKPRPDYDWHLKEPEEGIIHVADMDMKGLDERAMLRAWNNSFLRTAGILGHKPDDESAAKTTFVMPLELAGRTEA